MIFANALVILNTLVKSVSNVKSHSSSVISNTPLSFDEPAQFSNISTLPNVSSTNLAALFMSSVFVTSHFIGRHLIPFFSNSSFSSSSLSTLLLCKIFDFHESTGSIPVTLASTFSVIPSNGSSGRSSPSSCIFSKSLRKRWSWMMR